MSAPAATKTIVKTIQLSLYFDPRARCYRLLAGDGSYAVDLKLRGVTDFVNAQVRAFEVLGFAPAWEIATGARGYEFGRSSVVDPDLMKRLWYHKD